MSSYLGDDGMVLALLCSRLALPQAEQGTLLAKSECNTVEAAVAQRGDPLSALAGAPANRLAERYGLPAALSERVVRLLNRTGQFSVELDRLQGIGVWLTSRRDPEYPRLWRDRLGESAEPILFGAGDPALLQRPLVAIVGSRDASQEALAFAAAVAEKAVAEGFGVVSGGAKGIDRHAMTCAVERGGFAVGVLADSLERLIREPQNCNALREGHVCLVTPFHFSMHFTVGNAMGRNRLIYCLSQVAFVAAASEGTGGTWAGAEENLTKRWVPLYVRAAGEPFLGKLEERGANLLTPDRLAQFSLEELAAVPDCFHRGSQGALFSD